MHLLTGHCGIMRNYIQCMICANLIAAQLDSL